jgi:glucose/arabinose dehydrogenase
LWGAAASGSSPTTRIDRMKKLLTLLFTMALQALPAAHAADGAALYQQHCASCHGAERKGDIGPNLADATWVKVQPRQDALAAFISAGLPEADMPSFKAILGKDQIASIASYLLAPEGTPAPAKAAAAPAPSYPELANFRLPVGFSIEVFSDKVEKARSMVVAPSGVVFVGSGKAGKVYALVSSKRDYVVDKVVTVAEGLDRPIGVTYLDGALYVAEATRVLRFADIEKNFDKAPRYQVVRASLPSGKGHGEKVIKAGPDGKLYVPVGAPCNVCDTENNEFGKIYRMNPDGSQLEIYARGVRNTVGFAFHPETRQLWFTDNGRDRLGDNLPSDKLNLAPVPGLHFGFPYCAGGVMPDPEFAAGRRCAEFVAPMAKLGPHVASLGLEFNRGTQFPEQYRNQLFIAEHGSWNRSQKIGYRVALITLADNQVASDTVFVDFLHNGEVVGRPVDIAFLADGSMLISDDLRGRVYRVTYRAPAQ